MEDFRKRAPKGKRWCYDCTHYYKEGCFCGYSASMCRIYGSLDCDQRKRHPDTTADTCKDYTTEQIDYDERYTPSKRQPQKYDADLEFQKVDLSWLDNI